MGTFYKNKKIIIIGVSFVIVLIVIILLFLIINGKSYDGFLDNVNRISAWSGNVEYISTDREIIEYINNKLKNATRKSNYKFKSEGGYILEFYNDSELVCKVATGEKEVAVIKEGGYYIIDDKDEEIFNYIEFTYSKMVEEKYSGLLSEANIIYTYSGNIEYSSMDKEIIEELDNQLKDATRQDNYNFKYEGGYSLELYDEDKLVCEVTTCRKEIVVIKDGYYYIIPDEDKEIYNSIENMYLKMIEQKYGDLLSEADKIIVNNKGNEYIATDVDLINELNTVLSDADKMSNYSFKQKREYTFEAYAGDKNICKIYANSVEIVVTKEGYYYVIENPDNETYSKIQEIYERIINES